MAWRRRTIVQSSRCKSKALSAVFLSLRKNLASHSGVHVILWHSVYRAVGRSENLGGQVIEKGHIMEEVLVLFLLKHMGSRGGDCPLRPWSSDGPCHLMTLWEWKQPLTDDWTHISQPTRECWTIKRMGPSHHDNVVAEKWQKPLRRAQAAHSSLKL